MPAEPIYENGGEAPRGGTGGSGTGGIIPLSTQPVSPFPGLVYRSGFWYDPAADQWYDQQFNKLFGNPTLSRAGPPAPGQTSPVGIGQIGNPRSSYPPGYDPGDGPIPGITNAPSVGPLPSAPTSGPGSAAVNANYLSVPPAWSGSGPYQLANPMPTMPTMGTAPMQAYQAWALQQGRQGGAGQAFKPWGFPVGQVSDILRYGGSPSVRSQGGFAGEAGTAGGPGAPINVPGVPGWTSPGPGPGGTAGGLPGRTGSTGGQGYTPPPGGGGAGLPGRINPPQDTVPANETRSQRLWRLAGARNPESAGQPGGLTVDQIRLLLATQGKILRGL